MGKKKRSRMLYSLTSLLISGGISVGLFFALSDSDTNKVENQPKPRTTSFLRQPNTNTKKVLNSDNSFSITNSDKYKIDCDYSERFVYNDDSSIKVWEYYQKDDDFTEKDNRVCVVKVDGQITNNLPVFVYESNINPEITFTDNFHGGIKKLKKDEFEQYKKDGLSLTGFSSSYRKYIDFKTQDSPSYKKRYQNKVKENTIKLTEYLIDQLSFGSELNLLDVITLSTKNKYIGGDSKGLYSSNIGVTHGVNYLTSFKDRTLIPNGNKRNIDLTIRSSQYTYQNTDTIEKFRFVGENPIYDKEEYSGITFDLFEVGQTLSHEYGHLVTQMTILMW